MDRFGCRVIVSQITNGPAKEWFFYIVFTVNAKIDLKKTKKKNKYDMK